MGYPSPVFVGGNTVGKFAEQVDSTVVRAYRETKLVQQSIAGGSIGRDEVLRLIRVCGGAVEQLKEVRDDATGEFQDILAHLAELWRANYGIDKTPAEVNESLKAIYLALRDFRDFGIANFPKGPGDYLLVYKFNAVGETVPGSISPVPAAFSNAVDDLLAAFD